MEIWKFTLNLSSRPNVVSMPVGSRVLTLQVQDGAPQLWAIVNPSAERVDRYFDIVGTGWKLDPADSREYIGTFQDGPLVWHVFEVR